MSPRLRLLRLLLAAVVVLAACAPLAYAHRDLRQLPEQEVVPAAAAAAAPGPEPVEPAYEVFPSEVYEPTFPEAAALAVDTEVIIAEPGAITSQSVTPEPLSEAEAAAIKALVASSGPRPRCATNTTRSQQARMQRQMTAALKKRAAIGVANTAAPTIPVWFHVINVGRDPSQGNIPQTWINSQINVLNAAFLGRFRFQWAGTTRTTNAAWWNLAPNSNAGSPEMQMKQALRRGTVSTLNFYTSRTPGYLGWATFPGGSLVYDGVVCEFTSLPGSSAAPNNQGDTGVHEVGHWLFLYHTFQGGCSTSNDLVSDTPAEAGPDYNCQANKDSCPSLPGRDSINNYMNYGPDPCLTSFTPGQFTRMNQAWNAFRASTPSSPTCSSTAAPGGACGAAAAAGGVCCPSGQCCSQWGWCGITSTHCGAGCQRSFGTCQ